MGNVKKIPLRRCVVCGEMKTKKELLRVIKTSEDEIMVDVTGRKNGRGAYICNTKECIDRAEKNRGLEKSLKCSIPADVYDELRKEAQENAE